MSSGANISDCGTYRYVLWREIPGGPRTRRCLFVMLNPSTADAAQDDPTIRRCIGFAKREGCSAITVVNLFAYRATDPRELVAARARGIDIVGPRNREMVEMQLGFYHERNPHRLGPIVAAWGANRPGISSDIANLVAAAGAVCLGMNKDGSPKHPLYVRADQSLLSWPF